MRNKPVKPLIYTAVTNDSLSLSCADLLHKSIKHFLKDDYDFKIIVPEDTSYAYPSELKSYIFPIYNYHYKNTSIYTLRYDQKIFNQPYDYFIYMDSDILWMIDFLFDMRYNCICFEKQDMSHNSFSRGWPSRNRTELKKIPGINSGFFGISKGVGLNLADFMMRNLLTRRKLRKPMFEQNMFNYFIYHNYLISQQKELWININHKFLLGARADSIFSPQMAYHFFGDIGNMDTKLSRMTNFLSNNNIVL
jgi:hypothetical protein